MFRSQGQSTELDHYILGPKKGIIGLGGLVESFHSSYLFDGNMADNKLMLNITLLIKSL